MEKDHGLFSLETSLDRPPIRTTDFNADPMRIEKVERVLHVSGEAVIKEKLVCLTIEATTFNGASIDSLEEWALLLRDFADKIERVKFI